MEKIKEIKDILGIKQFNDLVITWNAGDEDYISDCLLEGEPVTPSPNNDWVQDLQKAGYNIDTFPYDEFRTYCDKVQKYLDQNLIVEI